MRIAATSGADLPAIRALLKSAGLPEQDLGVSHLQAFWRAEDAGGDMVGCIGLERFAHAALVRSLAVRPSARGAGIASALFEHVKAHALAEGVLRLFLLTNTAQAFFSTRGFTPCERDTVPAPMRVSPEFASLCPASAVCMSLNLTALNP
jgi:amino-acid N-acetyltransferase